MSEEYPNLPWDLGGDGEISLKIPPDNIFRRLWEGQKYYFILK